jgi:propionyl-CoA carboxylase alpha chain
MFKKILIANRGEIACRVIKTARKMGIKTVAVYSDADRTALHVRMADEAVHIGPPPASESYIVIDKIMEAIRATGAEAVHPGYGFLSENRLFAEALEAEGVAFIGPPAGAITSMGDKITSKKIAQEAGVSTVPGHMGLIEDADEAVKISGQIGYPVMLKASLRAAVARGCASRGPRMRCARGSRRRRTRRRRVSATTGCSSRNSSPSPGISRSRCWPTRTGTASIWVSGNARSSGATRRSSKRHRRRFLDEATRKAMGEQACALAQAVGYTSAGTVEFIVDGAKNFYFLEMNTRLQVEHPVTELITGRRPGGADDPRGRRGKAADDARRT